MARRNRNADLEDQLANPIPPEHRKSKAEILQEYIQNTDKTLLRPNVIAGVAGSFDLPKAQNYAQSVWSNFLSDPKKPLVGIYSLRQLMAMLSFININFDDSKQLSALYVIFHKHFLHFLKNEQDQNIHNYWDGFFGTPQLFSKPKADVALPNPMNEKIVCASNFLPLFQNPLHLLTFMLMLRHDWKLWRFVDRTALPNYASQLRSFITVTIDPLILKNLLKVLAAPAMSEIAREFFFQGDLDAVQRDQDADQNDLVADQNDQNIEDKGKFQENIALMEALLWACKYDKNPLECLESIQHLFTPKYLYALFPIIEKIHAHNPGVLKDFLWHASKQARKDNPDDAKKTIPIRMIIADLQQSIRDVSVTPMQHAIMEHPLIAKEMLYTPELVNHRQELKNKYWIRYPIFPSWVRKLVKNEVNDHTVLESTIISMTHQDIDLEQRVKAKYPTLSTFFPGWAREKFVKDLVANPQPHNLDFHYLCAKIASDAKFSKLLQVKDKSGWFISRSENEVFHEKTQLADASPFFAASVNNKSLTQSFLDASKATQAALMQQNAVKDFVTRQAFHGATLLEKLQLIQKYHVANIPNPFLALVDQTIFLQSIKAQFTKLLSQYIPLQKHNSPAQMAIFQQLSSFANALLIADQQKDSAVGLYGNTGALNFKKILKGSLLIDLVNKGIVNVDHQNWLDFKDIATTFVENYDKADLRAEIGKFHSAARIGNLVNHFETSIKAVRDFEVSDPIIYAGRGIWLTMMVEDPVDSIYNRITPSPKFSSGRKKKLNPEAVGSPYRPPSKAAMFQPQNPSKLSENVFADALDQHDLDDAARALAGVTKPVSENPSIQPELPVAEQQLAATSLASENLFAGELDQQDLAVAAGDFIDDAVPDSENAFADELNEEDLAIAARDLAGDASPASDNQFADPLDEQDLADAALAFTVSP